MTQPVLISTAELLRDFAYSLETLGKLTPEQLRAGVLICAEIRKLECELGDDSRREHLCREIELLEDQLPPGFEIAMEALEEMPTHLRVLSGVLGRELDQVYFNLK